MVMFKVAKVVDSDGLKAARNVMDRIYQECPEHWPYGLSADHFDSGLYLIREKRSSAPVGFTGFQRRWEFSDDKPLLTGYYSIGILPEYRNNGLAKEAVSKLLAMKAASVDRMQALIVAGNTPSLRLADALGVPSIVKQADDQQHDDNHGVDLAFHNLEHNHPIIPTVAATLQYLASKRLLLGQDIQKVQNPTITGRLWNDYTAPVRKAYHKGKSEAQKLQLSQRVADFLNQR
jgi:GNAT superfamily N-acetyltransferase